MKHTYLYPLGDGELWLWRVGRMGADDLFGSPNMSAPDDFWVMNAGISDALGEARERLHGRLKSRERICIGRHYAIPGSLSEVAQGRAREADDAVRQITALTWNAPVLDDPLLNELRPTLRRVAGVDARDDWLELSAFLTMHEGHRVVPVWM